MRPPAWTTEGTDPDYRFTLANERTFLAWIRTSFGLLAASVAVSQWVPHFAVPWARTVLSVLLATAGFGCAALSYSRWAGNERSMRAGRALPYTRLLPVLAALIGTVGAGALFIGALS